MIKYITIIILILIILSTYIKSDKVKIIDNFLDCNTCNRIIDSKDDFKRATVTSGNTILNSYGRTSSTTFFKKGENEDIDKIVKKLEKEYDIRNFEPVQMSRYEPGEKYIWHHDYFTKTNNQRHYTVVIYLNTVCQGGETEFKDCKIKPQIGKAIIWSNLKNGFPDKETLHRGNPPISGTKYILTLWSRVKKI